jgi:hypothetical protein
MGLMLRLRIFRLFGERKPRAFEPKHASITSYPDRINIDTYNKVGKDIWDWGSACIVTKLPIDVNNEEIGKAIRRHLALTRYNVKVKKYKTDAEGWHRYLAAQHTIMEAGEGTVAFMRENGMHLNVS